MPIHMNTITTVNGKTGDVGITAADASITVGSSGNNVTLSATAGGLQNPSVFKPADPAGTSSATQVMMGLGSTITFTPSASTKILVRICGLEEASASPSCVINGKFGTGAAPANGAAVTGTTFGVTQTIKSNSTITLSFDINDKITGLTLSTAYWFDLAVSSSGGATSTLKQIYGEIVEVA